ncbi:MAG: phenylacetic acid degradation bifunctional protein PaaZ [Pseudomonadota bacterium]
MGIIELDSFVSGRWHPIGPNEREIRSAVSGDVIAIGSTAGIDFGEVLSHARGIGGAALRALTFHDRASILKALALHLNANREPLYALSTETGATKTDSMVDIDGGIGTMFVYASKGKRELPNARHVIDGAYEPLARDGSFGGQHVYTSRQGAAIHINAFNFPVWGMLEKFAPTFLAGVPSVVKPATDTAYLTHACVKLMMESGLLPDGALQLVPGSAGDLLDQLTFEDVVAFTGSADTAHIISSSDHLRRNNVRFMAETDSLNATILGPDAVPASPEFDLCVKEVTREMTVKAGQKCTAIRRTIVPEAHQSAFIDALSARLAKVQVGHPGLETTRMGALAGQRQRSDVLSTVEALEKEATRVYGDFDTLMVDGADKQKGAFVSPILLHCEDPDAATAVHEMEAFGPVSTIMPYKDVDHAVELTNRGGGSLVASVFTHDADAASAFLFGSASLHGRMLFLDRDTAKGSTGHGSPMPHLVHGGPGRAGGGEELGGIRGVMHYMQRTALQGSPDMLTKVTGRWLPGAQTEAEPPHPFRLSFTELEIGKTIHTEPRTITLEDIEHFAEFTGDTFYAHMDEEAASANPFFPGRVAHGYLILSFAAGLFVDPAPGPVLANYGLDNLRFLKPVSPGDTIKVRLTAMEKKKRNDEHGEVRWNVEATNQDDEPVAQYELLTMNAM